MKIYIVIIKLLSAAAVFMAVFFVGFTFYFSQAGKTEETKLASNTIVNNNKKIAAREHLIASQDIENEKFKMLFFGDLMLDRHVGEKIKAAASPAEGLDKLLGKLASSSPSGFFSGYDLVACNLEGAVTDKGAHYAPNNAYDFAFAPELINGLKKYNFNFFNMANNHFSDQGESGIMETRKNLDKLEFDYAGCQDGKNGACISRIIEIGGQKIGLAGFSMVYSKFNQKEAENIVSDLASSTDLVVVNIHWGVEYQHQFNKTQQEIAHKLVDAGADMIIGHHPHVVQGMEIYQGKPIFYSLGNFVFDQYFSPDTQEGLAIGINIASRKPEPEHSEANSNSLQAGSAAPAAAGDYGASEYLQAGAAVPARDYGTGGSNAIEIFLYPLKSKASQVELMAGKDKEKFLEKFAGWSEADEINKEQIYGGKLLVNGK